MRDRKRKNNWSGGFALVLGLALAAFLRPVSAFQIVQTSNVTCRVVIGGVPPGKLKFQHNPLQKVSPVDDMIIIMGQAGSEVLPTQPTYEESLKTNSDFGPAEDRKIRVVVQYRFVPSLDNQDSVPFVTSSNIEGPDPTPFAFQIDPASVQPGFFQYRFVATGLNFVNGQLVPISQTTGELFTVGVQANASQVFGPAGGTFILANGNQAVGQTSLAIPSGVFRQPTTVSIDEIPSNSPSVPAGLNNPISVFHLDSDGPARGIFQLSLVYPDFEYPRGRDGVVDGTNIPVQNLSIQWWDGFVWRGGGGTINTKTNTISTRISALSFVAIMAAPVMTPEDRRPLERVITPNSDGINDVLNFAFGDLAEDVKVEIFDVGGHRVRTLHSLTNMQWDGRDDDGKVVESGVYIYQYDVNSKRISGVVAVAK